MLELKNITKIYETEGFKQKALDEVSINFRKCEFASILGPSGSGKTTLLNIIGGLDHYNSGDLIINEISTKKYKDRDWDSYRNHRIGFVFQNYNLITHQTILANVVLALTLSGISKKEGIKRAKKALKDVGLEKHINKKPNQLSGGQMQRVAIARALVNDPEILLADEPTGALDSETSVQIMDILKKIGKEKLVIMVTHNPDLAKEYSTRIIKLKDGKVTSDSNPYDGKKDTKNNATVEKNKNKKTNMSFKTALGLSFNNLMTKKGRTILVAFAGSIGIIGIALILALSTGFQNYIDSIQEDTLSSYPLMITEQSSDIAGLLLSLTSGEDGNDKSETVTEEQYMSKMFSSISSNDLRSFKKYLEEHYDEVKDDLSTVEYSYSVDPLIYTIDSTNTLTKVNPNNLFSAAMGSSSMLSSYSSMASIYSQMIDDKKAIMESYDILKGRLPEKYDEAVIVLSEANSISDLLLYSLGKKDNKELTKMMSTIMSGEGTIEIGDPLTLTYDDLLNTDLRVIIPSSLYKYNSRYKVYEDLSKDSSYMHNLYNNSLKLKIVGILCGKEGSNSMALSPGINYTSDLIEYIINESSKSDIVKKQIANPTIDVFSGSKFDAKTNKLDINFSELITIDSDMLAKSFGINLSEQDIASMTSGYMVDIQKSISVDTTNAKKDYKGLLDNLINDYYSSMPAYLFENDIDTLVDNYINTKDSDISALNNKYGFMKETLKSSYSGLLKTFLKVYVNNYFKFDGSLTTDLSNKKAAKNSDIYNSSKTDFYNIAEVIGTIDVMSSSLKEASMSKSILGKVSELTGSLIASIAKSFNVDEAKIASAFKFNLTEDEVTRIITAMNGDTEKTSNTNLIALGYQDLEEPTYISFYFTSFDAKEHFLEFIDKYNESVPEESKLNYSDTTGILMGSVKTIVNAVSYVLIAFVSVSLVVSSIMIGIITYISVYERTKEIGILRSIGASKKNISSIFNAETFIVGLLSGLIGIGITYTLIPMINSVIHLFTGKIPLSATLNIADAIKLIILSVILTLIGGLIPAKSASKKDPVEALRNE